MATHTNYNDFGAMVIENRPFAGTQIEMEDSGMTRTEWKKYLSLMDNVVRTSYDHMAFPNENLFSQFRDAVHKLYAFFDIDTRILAIDAYSLRLCVASLTMTTIKSKALKDAEKAVRKFKKAMDWALEKNGADLSDDATILFPNGMTTFYNSEIQDEYNQIVRIWTINNKANKPLTVGDLKAHKGTLDATVASIEEQAWQKYMSIKCDLPLDPETGKAKMTKHISAKTRKKIEDNIADMLTMRSLMTPELLEKEHKQIKGGRK